MSCLFCQQCELNISGATQFFFAFKDKYPVTTGHTLIIPKRHINMLRELSLEEQQELFIFINRIQEDLQSKDKTIQGFNIGVNEGEVSGQTIFHLHIHVIPRRKGDMADPRGGVRGVIPEKQKY